MLIELGADPRAAAVDEAPNGFAPPDPTPLGWARYANHPAVVAYLPPLAG